VRNWPEGFYEAMGNAPLTRLHATAQILLRPGGFMSSTHAQLQDEGQALFDPLYDLAVRLRDQHESFVLSSAFLPVAAEVYTRHTHMEKEPGTNTRQTRLLRAERWLRDFARWFEQIGGVNLPLPSDPTILWTVFKRDFERKARSVFIAMSFADDQTLRDV